MSKIIFLAKIGARNFFSKKTQAPPPEYQMDRALAETGMLQQTIRDWDKSIEVKQQVIDYFSRTHGT